MSDELKKLREQIDGIDDRIRALIVERAQCAHRVADVKRASDCWCEYTRVMFSRLLFSLISRWWWMRNSTSPQLRRPKRMKLSSVWVTMPSVALSTGTTP